MYALLQHLCSSLEQGKPLAVATIIVQDGSTPRGAGSKLLASEEGLVAGTVGGGLSEAQTLLACRDVFQDGPRVLDFHLDGQLAARSDMICGGQLRVLVEPVYPEALPLYRKVLEALKGSGGVMLTALPPDGRTRTFITAEGIYGAALAPDTLEAFADECAKQPGGCFAKAVQRTLCGRTYFIEPYAPPFQMLIAGGGHVSRPVAEIATLVGFSVTVMDDRPEFSAAERFPWCRAVCVPDYERCFSDIVPNRNTCIVIVTRGHLHDGTVLEQALRTDAGYIGMIGSKRKRDELYAHLRTKGVEARDLARVHCPIGLSIKAETPEEIAVSIVAECIAYRRGADVHEGASSLSADALRPVNGGGSHACDSRTIEGLGV